MYIKYEGQNYPCKCTILTDTISYNDLPETFPEAVQGEIVLCADDGFEMRTDNTENYLRQTFGKGTLTLTNVPEREFDPEPMPEPETELTTDDMAKAILEGVNEV